MHLRDAVAADAALLTAIAFDAKAVWGYTDAQMAAFRAELTVTADDIRSPQSLYRVCEVAGAVVGFHAVSPLSHAEVELDALFVLPARIGTGVGRCLMADVVSLAQRRGYTSVCIQSDPNAEGFYRAVGAVRVGERESDSVPGRLLPLLRLALSAPDTV
ncbi:MAG: GNAT family N-acetyltransferase [Pseudomonadota bacterium]